MKKGLATLLGVVFSVLIWVLPLARAEMVLLPENRIILGTVAEIAGDQVKIDTAEVMPRYLSVKQAREKGFWPFHKGDHLHIVVNEQNMVLGYHLVGDMGSHTIVHGHLAHPLTVGQEWAIVRTQGGEERIYRVRALVRSKLAAVSIGVPAVFLIDETNQIMDTAFGGDEAIRKATQGWRGSPPKGVNRQLRATIVTAMANDEVTVRTEDGQQQVIWVRPFLKGKLERLKVGDLVIFLFDGEDKVADVAF